MIFKLTLADSDYPALLREIPDPPKILYIKGSRRLLKNSFNAVAVVGTRRMTAYGKFAAAKIAGGLAKSGIIVVSGLAIGIDTSAHQAALDAGGTTIAVLGGGPDIIYPSSNRELYEKIVKLGLIISEFPPGTRPRPEYFPRRNRIISGLSLGVVVVEGQLKSGSIITAKLALDQGREVFAVPGPINSVNSEGPSYLIKNGAAVVETARDIIDSIEH